MGHRRERPLIFVHIPKAAGTTLREVIRAEYDAVLEIPTIPAYRTTVDALSAPELNAFDAFMGHMPFGLHERLDRPAAYITVLRDPVTRAQSLYSYLRRTPDHELHHEVVDRSFDEHVRHGGEERPGRPRRNAQTWFLAGGRIEDIEDADQSSPELLGRARANLERFLVVGTQERFGESVLLMAARLGWELPEVQRLNASDRHPDVSAETRGIILERHKLDVELHRYATGRLARDLRRRRVHTSAYVARQRSGPAIGELRQRVRRRARRLRRRAARSRG